MLTSRCSSHASSERLGALISDLVAAEPQLCQGAAGADCLCDRVRASIVDAIVDVPLSHNSVKELVR